MEIMLYLHKGICQRGVSVTSILCQLSPKWFDKRLSGIIEKLLPKIEFQYAVYKQKTYTNDQKHLNPTK